MKKRAVKYTSDIALNFLWRELRGYREEEKEKEEGINEGRGT